jgi:hypothetical protein
LNYREKIGVLVQMILDQRSDRTMSTFPVP